MSTDLNLSAGEPNTKLQSMKPITSLMNHRKSTIRSSWHQAVMAVLLVAVSGGNAVRAAITEYSDSGSFAAAVQPGSFLNNFTGANQSGQSLQFSGGTGPFAYTATSTGPNGVTVFQMQAASGLGQALSTFNPGVALIITFTGDNKPTAIGGNFFWSDFPADVISGTVHADFKIGGSSVHTFDVASTGNTDIGFGGITTDGAGFDSIELTLLGYTSGNFFSTVDNFHVGQAILVPEPSSWAVAGLVGLFFIGRAGWAYVSRRNAVIA